MPSLYAFVVCDKVILDQSGLASLISLFSIITAGLPTESSEIPPNAVAPKEWAVFTSWDWEPGDEGKEYTHRTQILHPDGTLFLQIPDVRFIMQPGRKQQITSPVLAIPIGQRGMCKVRMWLEFGDVTVFEPRPIEIEIKHEKPGGTP
jgi:hypothetical protein